MRTLIITLTLVALSVSGCASYSTQRYTAMPDNAPILKALSVESIRVEPFVLSAAFQPTCRAVANLEAPVNMTIESYVQTALADELKVAGLYDDKNPKTKLSGNIDKLSFTSSKGLKSGEWNIGLQITSSNGKSFYASENYQFESAIDGATACRRTADALFPAVQSLIYKIIRNEEFHALLKT